MVGTQFMTKRKMYRIRTFQRTNNLGPDPERDPEIHTTSLGIAGTQIIFTYFLILLNLTGTL